MILEGEAYSKRLEGFSNFTLELILDIIGASRELAKKGDSHSF